MALALLIFCTQAEKDSDSQKASRLAPDGPLQWVTLA